MSNRQSAYSFKRIWAWEARFDRSSPSWHHSLFRLSRRSRMGPLARNSPGPPRLRPSLWREATATYRSLQQNSTSRAERVQQEWLYVPYASSVGCPGRPPATQPLAGFPGRVTHPASGGRSGSGGRHPPSLWRAPAHNNILYIIYRAISPIMSKR